jgi:hypothetical protein
MSCLGLVLACAVLSGDIGCCLVWSCLVLSYVVVVCCPVGFVGLYMLV